MTFSPHFLKSFVAYEKLVIPLMMCVRARSQWIVEPCTGSHSCVISTSGRHHDMIEEYFLGGAQRESDNVFPNTVFRACAQSVTL